MTQALALASMLARAGHTVCNAVISRGGDNNIPTYFEKCINAPITYMPSARFIVDDQSRAIHWGRTLLHNSFKWKEFNQSFSIIQQQIAEHKPDVVINFYEPLAGFFMVLRRPAIPMIAVAHQFMLMHPRYVDAPGFRVQKHSVRFFTSLTGLRAKRLLALSLYGADPLPGKKLVVVPPLLRDELFRLPSGLSQPFYLIYLFHHSLSKDVEAWHRRHPDVEIHCFWNNPKAEQTTRVSDNLTFHRLHGQRFLDMMAQCRGIITTSGFETMAEAMYLSKPLILRPLHRHFEQHCNAIDGSRMGAAIQASEFDLEKLITFAEEYRYDATDFRKWVQSAEETIVREIESVVDEHRGDRP